jgi:hypothetical protein
VYGAIIYWRRDGRRPEELETWGEGIEFLEQWFYMDSNHPKLGLMRIFRNMAIFRNTQYTARYALHAV